MTSIRVRPKADADLTAIFDYSYRNWGFAQAELYVAQITAMFARIATDPKLGKPASARHPTLFRQSCGAHFIVFARVAEGVEIIRVLHQRMDIEAQLD
ncbi:MAG: type II toxin-antitoxin system RelE/ParE family toxin [Sphingomonas sp.]|uniref:type II toxin-antitoxin system RelE/ParE family toxin n=1 Tax=Sphingomonas sp. TaxID=28214 RepID=UPI003F34A4E6